MLSAPPPSLTPCSSNEHASSVKKCLQVGQSCACCCAMCSFDLSPISRQQQRSLRLCCRWAAERVVVGTDGVQMRSENLQRQQDRRNEYSSAKVVRGKGAGEEVESRRVCLMEETGWMGGRTAKGSRLRK
eukprot:768673-Hanusia_phi.AAC.15